MATIAHLPPPLVDNYAWQMRGACRTVDPESFFPPETERGAKRTRREGRAKELCRSCPVIQECLAYALRVGEPYGVWGGMTAPERAALIAQQRAS